MTTLITGGAGFVGSYLARMLVDAGEQPVLFDIAAVQGPLAKLSGRFVLETGDLAHLSVLMDCVERNGIDRIFHLGGMLSLPSEQNPRAAFDANVIGTYNVLEAARIKRISQVIYGSTIATYSKDIPGDEIDDRTIQRPSSFYGVTKTFGELLGRFYHRKFGLDFRGVRLPSVVGPGARTAHMSIYNAWAIEHALKGLPYVLECAPETRCPAIYYKDAARALSMLSDAEPGKVKTRIYNIAGITPPFSASELVDTIRRKIPRAELSFSPDPVVVELLRELGSLRINDDAAGLEWGWRAAYSLEALVEDFVEEFQKSIA
ncbi:MAG: NAD-dependent epimerase/dehydratase family protein [Desulfobacteraceae bacterium]|nr:MAG: NAD-dependent epimerase/dehydratase family protein [Desulfobacteraceae bacterium]